MSVYILQIVESINDKRGVVNMRKALIFTMFFNPIGWMRHGRKEQPRSWEEYGKTFRTQALRSCKAEKSIIRDNVIRLKCGTQLRDY